MRCTEVMHIIETLGSGGAERLLYTNLQHLDPKTFHSTVITLFSGDPHWAEPIRKLGVEVLNLDCRTRRDTLAAVARLVALMRARKIDLVHTHLLWANLVGRLAGRLARVPVISSVHNPEYEPEVWKNDPGVSRGKVAIIRYLDRCSAHLCCQRLIAVSEYVRQSTHRHLRFPLERVERVYNPIDITDLETPSARPRAELVREWVFPEDSIILLNVGRVAPQKGLIDAVRALPTVLRRFPKARLVSAGVTHHREYVTSLEKEVQALGLQGYVRLLGPRRDVPDLLRSCDLFLFPSIYEGQGIALVEAMAIGCACIASSTGPIPEFVVHQENGWLIPPSAPEALADAICTLLADGRQREELGGRAQATALNSFRPEAATRELAAIYRSVLDSRGFARRRLEH